MPRGALPLTLLALLLMPDTRRAPLNLDFQYGISIDSTRTDAPERGEWMNMPLPT